MKACERLRGPRQYSSRRKRRLFKISVFLTFVIPVLVYMYPRFKEITLFNSPQGEGQSAQRQKIAIIGASGYIGSRLFVHLKDIGHIVVGYDRLARSPTVHNISSSKIPSRDLQIFNIVIYLGGLTGRVACDENPHLVENENIKDIVELTERMHEDQHLIFASTSAVTEGSADLHVDESWQVQEGLLDLYSKSMFHREIALNSTRFRPKRIGLRFGTVVGRSYSQRIDLMHMAMVCGALEKGKIKIATPLTYRSFLHMEDLMRAMQVLIMNIDKMQASQIFHLASFSGAVGTVASEVAYQTGAIAVYQHVEHHPLGFSLKTTSFEQKFGFTFQGENELVVRELISHASDVCQGRETTIVPESTACVVCGSRDMHSVLDLGTQPLANDFSETFEETADVFPLHLVRCKKCQHTQLSHIVDRERLFANYKYVSGTSSTLNNYFKWLANKIVSESGKTNGTVLEIACNDGSQLSKFAELGWETYGVDPAGNILSGVSKIHKVYEGFWGKTRIPQLDGMQFDAIVAQNVLAHVPSPVEFMRAFKEFMHQSTKLYIQTSQCDMLANGQFDTIYHEHISFFTMHSFQALAKLSGMKIIDFQTTEIHGGSCLVTFQISGKDINGQSDGILRHALARELILGINEPWFFKRYKSSSTELRDWMRDHLNLLHQRGYKIAGYGAAAKGIVLLHFIGFYDFEFVIDEAPFKQNSFCPGTSIPVKKSSELNTLCGHPFVVVLFAWNFAQEILGKMTQSLPLQCSPMVMVPFPNRRMFSLRSSLQVIYPTIGMKWPLPVPDRKIILFSHMFNEETLLPFWIRHHASMFDKAIIFDYGSNDSSIEIFDREAPSSWELRRSRNSEFDASLVDEEIMEEEAKYPGAFRIALTTTEFLIHQGLRRFLSNMRCPTAIKFRSFSLVGNDSSPLLNDVHLLQQRSILLADTETRREGDLSYSRYLHCYEDLLYSPGRHVINKPHQWASEGVIIKTEWSPWPEIMNRKLQVGTRIPKTDVVKGFGAHHTAFMNISNLLKSQVSIKQMIEDPSFRSLDLSKALLEQQDFSQAELQAVHEWVMQFDV